MAEIKFNELTHDQCQAVIEQLDSMIHYSNEKVKNCDTMIREVRAEMTTYYEMISIFNGRIDALKTRQSHLTREATGLVDRPPA